MPLYMSRELKNGFTKGGLNDNALVFLIYLCAAADENGWVYEVSIPAIAAVAGYEPKQFYVAMAELEHSKYVTRLGDHVHIKNHNQRFQKGGLGAFVIPDIILNKRFTRGTTLRAKRLALWLLSLGLADKTNRRFKKESLKVTKAKLIAVTGALGPAMLEEQIIKQVNWLFNFKDLGDRYEISVNERYLVRPDKKPHADYVDLANLRILVAKYRNVKNMALASWKDLLWLWTTYGGIKLHQALADANKRASGIRNLPAYLHGILKVWTNDNLKLSTMHS